MIVDPGKLRHRVELQQYTITTDSVGNQRQSWKTVAALWAGVNSLYGQEYWTAAAQGQQNTVVFVVRHTPMLAQLFRDCDLTRWRILMEGQPYAIQSCDDMEYRHVLVKIKAVRS